MASEVDSNIEKCANSEQSYFCAQTCSIKSSIYCDQIKVDC
jgi:hypothetical protein